MSDTPKKDVEELFKNGLLVIGMLLLFIATFHFYGSMEDIIRIWFEYQYVPIFKAAFNLLLMVICLYLIRLYLVKR